MAYNSKYTGAQIDLVVGSMLEDKETALSLPITSWTNASSAVAGDPEIDSAYFYKISGDSFSGSQITLSGGALIVFYDNEGNKYETSYTFANSAYYVFSNVNIAGTFYILYGANAETNPNAN